MSVVRPKPPVDPIHYDPAAIFATGGITRQSLDDLAPALASTRARMLDDVARFTAGGTVAGAALEPAFIDLPERLLADYNTRRPQSELFAILTVARRIRETVDRVVVLGNGGSSMGTRAIFESCCHPFHNELPRGERGGRPRLSFEGWNIDNDSAQGLLDLLRAGRPGDDLLDRWAIVVVSRSDGPLETAIATRLFLKALFEAVGSDRVQLAERVVPITGKTERLAELARAIGCPDGFDIPDGIGERFSVFTAVGLLPAAIVGVDVVRLLEGAAAMNRRFREAPPAENPVLEYAGASHLAERELGAAIRVLSSWSNRLEAVGRWYDHLLSRGQQHQDGRRGTLITNLLVSEPRRDRLTLPAILPFAANEDGLDDLVGRSWPDMLAATANVAKEAWGHDGRPTADVFLPRVDEHTVGQLLQMLMLATVAEGRLVGRNPSGKAGVEAYNQSVLRRLQP